MAKTVKEYGNESITQLKGPDQVRLRPAVIFGSDGLDGCKHSVFEIISNSIDEAREGYGKKIIVTPGIVECGVLEETINGAFGAELAKAEIDKVILVGTTLVGAVKAGYQNAQGNMDVISTVKTLEEAKELLKDWVKRGDAILFLNDLPDVY